jgi:hypothetical protein
MSKRLLDVRVGEEPTQEEPKERRCNPHLNVLYACCQIYGKVFRRPEANHYLARCPKCGWSARFAVGEGGSASRFWRVG